MATKREKEIMHAMAEAALRAARGHPQAAPTPEAGHADIDHLGHALNELMGALRSTREEYTLVTDKISDVIWIMDMDLNFTYMSPSTERMHGRKPEEWLSMSLEDALPLSSLGTAMHALAEELAIQKLPGADRNRFRTLELEQYRKDGSTFWSEVKASFMWGDSPDPIGVIGVTRDISERKRADEALCESEERFRTLFCTAPFTCAVTDSDGRFIMVNDAFLEKIGMNRDQVIGRTMDEIGVSIDPAALESLNRERLRTGMIDNAEVRVVMPDGTANDLLVSSRNISLSGQDCTLSVTVDITARKQIEQEGKRLTAILESTSDLVATATPEGTITYLNAAARRVLGLGAPVDTHLQVLYSAHPAWARRIVRDEAIPTAIERGVWQGETAVLDRDGREIPVSQVIMAHRSDEGELLYLSTIMRDLSEHRRSEEALRKSESTYRNMVVNSPVGMHFYRLEPDGRLVLEDANPAADHILGIDHHPLLGKDILDAFPQLAGTEVPLRYREAASSGITWETEQIFYEDESIHGAFMVRAFQTTPGRMVAEFVDITARKRAEIGLRESEERFRALHNASFGGIGIHERGIILDCNQGLADMTGYSPDELIGMNGLNLIAPEWREHVMEKIVTGYERTYEVRGLRKDGSTYPLEIHGKNVPYHGRTVRVTEFRDITDRKQAEETLR
ncbi:MAG TPA: PAS domain S-box protein, partial [Deltaproteobacteria bacterium]|nr:PAS domain S-box protein [Deltaproteobacteria bacterium]